MSKIIFTNIPRPPDEPNEVGSPVLHGRLSDHTYTTFLRTVKSVVPGVDDESSLMLTGSSPAICPCIADAVLVHKDDKDVQAWRNKLHDRIAEDLAKLNEGPAPAAIFLPQALLRGSRVAASAYLALSAADKYRHRQIVRHEYLDKLIAEAAKEGKTP